MKIQYFLFLSLICFAFGADELKFVVEVFRHGHRAPEKELNFFDSVSWPKGFGELTAMGQRMHYLLGQLLREKYIVEQNLLDENYNQKQIYIRSTDYTRTIMSAQSQLLGIYGAGNVTKLTEKQIEMSKPFMDLTIDEQIITELKSSAVPFDIVNFPIHAFGREYDDVILYDSCPLYGQITELSKTSTDYKDVIIRNQEFFKQLAQILEFDYKILNQGANAYYLADSLISADFDCRRPEGITDQMMQNIKEIIFQFDSAIYLPQQYPIMKNLTMYGFAREMNKYFNQSVQNDMTDRNNLRFVFYSTHDTTLQTFLAGLEHPATNIIPYSSNLIFELYKREDSKEHYVKVFYNGEDLNIFGKTENEMEYEEFLTALNETAVKDYAEECKIKKDKVSKTKLENLLRSEWDKEEKEESDEDDKKKEEEISNLRKSIVCVSLVVFLTMLGFLLLARDVRKQKRQNNKQNSSPFKLINNTLQI